MGSASGVVALGVSSQRAQNGSFTPRSHASVSSTTSSVSAVSRLSSSAKSPRETPRSATGTSTMHCVCLGYS